MSTPWPANAPVYPTQAVTVVLPDPADLKPIVTERLILRPFQLHSPSAVESDAAGHFVVRSHPDVANWIWPKSDTCIELTKEWMKGKTFSTPDASGAVNCRHFFFTIVPRSDPSVIIGGIGVNSLYPAPSVGYALHPDYWGKGLATEAVRGVVDAWWGLPRVETKDGQRERLFAATKCANVGSFKVLAKAGFEVYEYFEYEGRIAFMCIEKERGSDRDTKQ